MAPKEFEQNPVEILVAVVEPELALFQVQVIGRARDAFELDQSQFGVTKKIAPIASGHRVLGPIFAVTGFPEPILTARSNPRPDLQVDVSLFAD